ncbi:polysaccharide deacetylase family protein [Nonomuraea sp. M3C6]|uniref:Polysaccharide deacetylase family protein n=1 Tax=Nonomuraea marmarensis TaxID=3351344 RepID=A0ABW7ALI4_9ACTN
MKDITVGVVADGGAAGWLRVLAQEGIAHQIADIPDSPVVLVSGRSPAWLEAYVAKGGVAVVSGARQLPFDIDDAGSAVVSGFETPVGGRFCAAPGLVTRFPGAGEGVLRLHEDRIVKYGSDPDRFPVVLSRRIGAGAIVYSGVALTELLMAQGDRLRAFCEFTEVTERVAAVDKADVADTLLHMLRLGFQRAGLPMVRLPRFPGGARSVFILRVDVDGAYAPHTQNLVDAARAANLPASFYVNADLSSRFPGLPDSWPAEFEVGQHAQAHTLFDTYEENLANLKEGRAWVEARVGRDVTSFVAPRGMWNASLGEALAQIGYSYSSEFGLDFDSLPFRAEGGILQVPVHPYSPERASRWAEERGVTPPGGEETRDYFLAVMRRQLALGRPMHVYGHPEVLGGMADTVVPAMAAFALREQTPCLTLGAYAAFWQRREEAYPTVRYDLAAGTLQASPADSSLPLIIEVWEPTNVRVRERETRLPAGTTLIEENT